MAEIVGDSGDNTLIGTAGDDIIRGLGGNDVIRGGNGKDELFGGDGDDIFYIDDNSGDIIRELIGGGNDAVYVSVSYVLTPGAEVELLSTNSYAATTAINLTGNSFNQTIAGNAGNNILNGGGGIDILFGFGGNDTFYIDVAATQVIEAVGGGNDAVYTSVSYALGAGQEIELLSANSYGATTPLSLTGNSFSQTLVGNAGNNIFNGGGGNDILHGLGGNDTYYVDLASVQVIEAVGGGNDAIYTSVSYTLGAGQEIELLSVNSYAATTPINLTGNTRAQTIVGNSGKNTLIGGGGADILIGQGGDDIYFVDNSDIVIQEAVGGGTDVVYATRSYTLTAGAEVEILSTSSHASLSPMDLTGNTRAQTIIGNNGVNVLNGGGGADTLSGLGGNDVYIVDNAAVQIVETAGGGFDVVYSQVSYVLGAGVSVEHLSVNSIASVSGYNLTGNELAQTVVGNNGANVLDGKGGNDVLTGNGGADTFAFTTALGAGNIDQITDFNVVDDTILLGGAAGQPFAILATGALRAGTLVIGTAALDADDYLIYNSGTGALLFDADGNGAGAAVQFATLATGLALTVADFIVSGLANNAPVVTSGASASVAENSAASTIVYQATATDANGDRITWSLSGTDAGLLTIDANGAVRLINPADFETKSSYTFNVVASDSGVSTPRAVTLTITDVNENVNTPTLNEIAGPNDTANDAQVIDPGTLVIANNPDLYNDDLPSITILGSISAPGDVDYYRITLQAGQQLILDVDGTNGLDSFLTLYGPNNGTSLIGENDDQVAFDPGSNQVVAHNWDSQIIFRAGVTGEYWFSIKSFVGDQGPTTSGSYELHVSINSVPATAAQIMAEDVQALISGAAWNRTNLTYGFPSSASHYPQAFDEVNPATDFEAFSAGQQAATRSLLQLIANVSPLTFTENTTQGSWQTAGTAANADLRFAESSDAEVAYAYYPTNVGPQSLGGSAWFNKEDFNLPAKGNYAWMGILHEIGHALGLKHGHEFPLAISADHDSVEYSVMTYRSYPGDNISGYNNEQYGFAQTLMMLDIAALQQIYGGANYAFNSGNSTYTWNVFTGEMSINGVGQGAPGDGVSPGANRVFMTVWDGGGTDTYDLSNYSGGTTIDLRPGEWTTTSTAQLANLGAGNFARGNIANALLFEGNTASAIENAKGGSGADTLIANLVANQFTGGGGNDVFKWMAASDAGTGALADTVLDFVRGADKIDFSALDAQPGVAGQQDFAFIGTGAFTSVAGQVRYDVVSGNAHIFADVDGNGTADMQIILNGITTLAASDFNF